MSFRQDVLGLFISVIDVSFEVALREIRRVSGVLQEGFHIWNDYDAIAYWAIDIIKSRKNENDEINIEAGKNYRICGIKCWKVQNKRCIKYIEGRCDD